MNTTIDCDQKTEAVGGLGPVESGKRSVPFIWSETACLVGDALSPHHHPKTFFLSCLLD